MNSKLVILTACLLIYPLNVTAQSVFAHVVAGNSGSYAHQDWLRDITLAKTAGIDGFIMNIAPNTYNLLPMLDLVYAVAAEIEGFKIWLSFDYVGGTNPDSTPWHADQICALINNYSGQPAQYLWNDNKPAVTTFQSPPDLFDWISIKETTGCFFIPVYSSLGLVEAAKAPGVDGLAAWDDAAWAQGPNEITTMADENYLSALGGRPYMMPVSPWFFRKVSGDNWLWRGDDLWYNRWDQVAQIKPDIVQILSWNDYGESHYVGPLPPNNTNAIPEGATYVEGYPHDAWLNDLSFYIACYKGITPPVTDHITLWHRLNPSLSGSDGGTTCNPPSRGLQLYPPDMCSQDIISITVLASDAGNVTGGMNGEVTLNAKVNPGLNYFSMPFDGSPGFPKVSLERNGQIVTEVAGGMIEDPPDGVINWNAYVAG